MRSDETTGCYSHSTGQAWTHASGLHAKGLPHSGYCLAGVNAYQAGVNAVEKEALTPWKTRG